jgi:glycerol uptake operon antiterminator
MATRPFDQHLHSARVIPALRNAGDVEAARAAPSAIVYLLAGDIVSVGPLIDELSAGGKLVCVNIDLLAGLKGDAAAVTFLAKCGASGVISTHAAVLAAARSSGLYAIQRSFMLDSQAVSQTVRALERFVPDAVEVLPAAVAPRTLGRLRSARTDLPVIAGGLIEDFQEIDRLVAAGVDAVSVSAPTLWLL